MMIEDIKERDQLIEKCRAKIGETEQKLTENDEMRGMSKRGSV